MFNFLKRRSGIWVPDPNKALVKQAGKLCHPFDDAYPLLSLSPADTFTVRSATEGFHAYGGNGRGKTSGPGQAFAKAYMRAGFGGIALTAKADECALIGRYARETGREDDVIVFSPEERWRFNFLAYEQRRPRGGGLTENIVKLFTTVIEAGDRGEAGGGKHDRYWKNALQQLLRNGIDLPLLARPHENLSVARLNEIISSAPRSLDMLDSEHWQKTSLCYRMLEEALAREDLTEIQKRDLDLTGKFWLNEFPQLPFETRGSIISTFTTTADVFLRGPIGELFSTGLNVVPELTHEGAILIIDLPVKLYGQVGIFSQILMKYVWQQAAERRDLSRTHRPIFIWADESHNFVNEQDVLFQTTARSTARACTVYMTQTRPNYLWALGGEDKGAALTDSLMGVLQTHCFCGNSDPATNAWAASYFAKGWQQRSQSGVSHNQGNQGSNAGFSDSLEHHVREEEFQTLPRGGTEYGLQVGAIIGQGGRIFKATGQTHLRTLFRQDTI